MGIHDGHRDRLRNRFLTHGLDSLEEHEVLELLLFYAIPQKDTNEIAHRLINKFGSLAKVMDAPASELMTVEGVGKNSASLILLAKPLCRRYLISQNDTKEPLNSVEKTAAYLSTIFFGAQVEMAYILCLDVKSRPICCREISSGSAISTTLPQRKAVQIALDSNAVAVILAHNHPNAPCAPSAEDRIATKNLKMMLESVGIRLLDHFIFGADKYISFSKLGFFY